MCSVRVPSRRRKIASGSQWLGPATDPRGYSDYETGRVRSFHPASRPTPAKPLRPAANTYFPALEGLDAVLAELPPQTAFVIVMPPVYQGCCRSRYPVAADLPACKAALARRSAIALAAIHGICRVDRSSSTQIVQEHYRRTIRRASAALQAGRSAATWVSGRGQHPLIDRWHDDTKAVCGGSSASTASSPSRAGNKYCRPGRSGFAGVGRDAGVETPDRPVLVVRIAARIGRRDQAHCEPDAILRRRDGTRTEHMCKIFEIAAIEQNGNGRMTGSDGSWPHQRSSTLNTIALSQGDAAESSASW